MFRLLEFGRCDPQRLFLCHERRWIVRNLFQRAGSAVRNVAGRIRSAFSRGGSRSSGS